MASYSSEDEFPELSAILAPKPLMATSTNSNLRRSPRKKGTVAEFSSGSPEKKKQPCNLGPVKSASPASVQPTTTRGASPTNAANLQPPVPVPGVSRRAVFTEIHLSSNNRQSPARENRPLRIPHVDSLLLPRSAIAKQEQLPPSSRPTAAQSKVGSCRIFSNGEQSMMSLMTEAARKSEVRQSPRKKTQMSSYTSRFVLKEAHCNDDEDSVDGDDDDDEEDTDLSGFIVDDDAELSYHDSSASESEDEAKIRNPTPSVAPPRRRLIRGSPTRRRLSFLSIDDDSDKEKTESSTDRLADAFQNLDVHEDSSRAAKSTDVQVIDLTSSPNISPKFDPSTRSRQPILNPHSSDTIKPANTVPSFLSPFEDFETVLKLAPPVSQTSATPPSKMRPSQSHEAVRTGDVEDELSDDNHNKFRTPPKTPPKSKIHSPSKLLSPSKRQYVPRSPHRPSMDTFWDQNVINDWNDEFLPKMSPAKSPRKGLARFQIYSDSEDDNDNSASISSNSLPSPYYSPRKSKSRSLSPLKSPEKEEKRRLTELKKAAAAKKKEFDGRKEKLALDLLHELDRKVAKSQLLNLASSTGGVQIIWSKTLRSTAGRANWRRTASKISGSPIKGGVTEGPGVEIKHFASIELAEKIIDSEDRLVNTLAHEFCHLTNFMISNVRDQPHGASFKSWAAKVTNHLRKSEVAMWRKVEVTTKHNYAINHKYLWVCAGREQTKTMEFLNIDEDEGCGAEYGRHSRSIDTAKHRCGKCKGRLVQVRPKPRAPVSPRKQLRDREVSGARSSSGGRTASSSSSSSSQNTTASSLVGYLVDLSD
ncbi:uncharacterized protein A1O9_00251 [Exophiala aquamarina CBS 119918]|uniref:SprT-like domain-containing protein n=1 Tax=Exophiala aquamarina CBS 119918 TaxID=1182545 RepID=A0A072PQD4_9EURO|nr:uncharacterized protein A1O9_00251 [Exophiala aquamarina CBS 119918]KEF62279.1 hypothetical protein A1O9_00251 [Exophiala aquamarina CBS 119918]